MTAKDRILARRAKFMAAAIVGIAGCGSEATSSNAQACLKVAPDAAVDARDTEPAACLFAPVDDTGRVDTGSDTTVTDAPSEGG